MSVTATPPLGVSPLPSSSPSQLMRDLTSVPGLFVEIGGPTTKGYPGIDTATLGDRLIVSNLFRGVPMWDKIRRFADTFEVTQPVADIDRRAARRLGLDAPDYIGGRVQLMCDGTAAPLRSNSVAGILASCLPKDVRDQVIREAARALKPGGLLVWRANINEENDLRSARAAGLIEHSRPAKGVYVWQKPLR